MLELPVIELPGVGPARADALARKGVRTLLDVLFLIPSRYECLAPLTQLGGAQPGERLSLVGFVKSRRRGRLRRRKGGFLDLMIEDEAGVQVPVRLYGQVWLFDRFSPDTRVLISGRFDGQGRAMVAEHHVVLECEEDPGPHLVALHPRLPAIEGVPPGTLLRIVHAALERVDVLEDPIPPPVLADRGLPTLAAAFRLVHRPSNSEEAARGAARLMLDRFVALMLPVARGRPREPDAPRIETSGEIRSRIRSRFPFPFTPGQESALEVVLEDLARPIPMRRLLQGDVGAGKTAVAVAAALAVVASGRQVLLLAPTEPLAWQHHRVVGKLLEGSRVELGLLSGRLSASERKGLLEALPQGHPQLLVGTHAALSDSVTFRDLGLVVVDEQQRFGVRQRLSARAKGNSPHMLAMSATPIPRSLCLALLGDLDHSVIPDRPPGRAPTETRLDPGEDAWGEVQDAVRRGERAFVVFPAIDAEEMPALLREGRALASGPLRGLTTIMLHGRMDDAAREEALRSFRNGPASVLVSTVMVEVGLDVADATVMVVVGAERFGLSTLHQLRGRVGRGARPGLCLLVPGPGLTPAGQERLNVLAREPDGFRIAEADLRLRGAGEIAGVRQAGPGGALPVEAGTDENLLEAALDVARVLVATGRDLRYHELLGSSLQLASSLPADAV